MASNVGSGSEAEMHNSSKSADLVGIGAWANLHDLEDKTNSTDKNNKKRAPAGILDRRYRPKNSEWDRSPMTRWLNEDRKAGPWSHVK